MKNEDKNRDPELARKRAVADARCALRKLGLLDRLERAAAGALSLSRQQPGHLLLREMEALGILRSRKE